MKQYWQNLSIREQRLLIITSIFLLTIGIYLLAWKPLNTEAELNQTRIIALQKQYSEMQSIAQRINAISTHTSTSKIKDNGAMLSLIERTATQRQLRAAIQKIQPEANLSVRLWVEDIPFDTMLSWFNHLLVENNIVVSEINVDASASEGQVSGRILFQVL